MAHDIAAVFHQIADGLAEQGYAVIDHFLSPQEAMSILQSDEFSNRKLHFKKAAIGKVDKQINEGIRGDYIQWIDPNTASPGETIYLSRLREMIAFLNQNLFLSLKDVEIHRTVYPVGTRYQRHLDQFRTDDHRKLSIICYLNADWTPEHGGQLRLHLPLGEQDFLPEQGRLVCFRSDEIEHEVLPATRERYSLTGWAVDRVSDVY
jgi:SM-20-related protein